MRLILKKDLTLTKVAILSIAKAIERTAGHKKFVLDKILKKCYNYYTIKKGKKFPKEKECYHGCKNFKDYLLCSVGLDYH